MRTKQYTEGIILMKKNLTENSTHRLRAANKRYRRSLRIKGPGVLGYVSFRHLKPKFKDSNLTHNLVNPTVYAPPQLDMYARSNLELFSNFLENLRLSSKYNDHVIISFKGTNEITACAGLRLLAEVSHLLKLYPTLSFSCSFAKQRHNRNKKTYNRIEQGLQQIGFFDAIRQPNIPLSRNEHVAVWQQLSGNLADGSLAASLLNSLPDSISKISKSHLYKGAIEAMANSVDHAYPSEEAENSNAENRWWMLVGKMQNSIT